MGGTKRVHFFLSLLLSLALLPGCGADKSESAAALGSGNLRWNAFPIFIRADNKLLLDGGAAEEDLLSAIAFWENRAGKVLFRLSDWPSNQAPFTGPAAEPDTLIDNVIFFQAPWPFEPRVAGKTIIHSKGGIIKNAVIFLNHDTSLCSGLCEEELDHTSRRKLLAHELGHFIGFAHVDDRENVMFPEILQGGSLEGLRVDDGLLRKLVTF